MDTEKCKVLLTSIETGSFTAAADKMGYTPSGISRSIAALEEETGFSLLRRSRSGVVPTAECQRILPILQELLRWEECYRQTAGEILGVETGEIAVGTAYHIYYPQLCGWITEFSKSYPGISVGIVEGTSSELSRLLEQGRLHFCIISKREGNLRWVPLKKDQLVAGVPKGHSIVKRGSVPLSLFETEPFIQIFPGLETDNSRLFQDKGIRPHIRYATSDDEAAFAMVEAGLGVTVVNAIQVGDWSGNMEILPLDPPEWVEIGIAMPTEEMISPAAKRFAAFAIKHFSKKE
ncbi:MAG: LysR family transcriptional regulator [Anaerotignum sp.]|nr:LysR family transcriptional regulator [Anaerotignum sp.]